MLQRLRLDLALLLLHFVDLHRVINWWLLASIRSRLALNSLSLCNTWFTKARKLGARDRFRLHVFIQVVIEVVIIQINDHRLNRLLQHDRLWFCLLRAFLISHNFNTKYIR